MSASSFNENQKFKCEYDKENKTLNNVPIWMLFIDKDCHSQGEMVFDNTSKSVRTKPEPGYNAAMYSAFDYMLTNLGKKLDAEEFKHIHSLCVEKVENIKSNKRDFDPNTYGFIYENVSKTALSEWKSEKLIVPVRDIWEEKVAPREFLAFSI